MISTESLPHLSGMRIALFGATGRVGGRLLDYTLAAGHTVRALVRGVLQVEDGVWNIRAKTFLPLKAGAGEDFARGPDFH